ncbi:MAG: LPS-assembly protein LptD, partial [Planctomycetes bacterium]|nr:LPS-assembly protein LptD [Planctomycetota bacterium]
LANWRLLDFVTQTEHLPDLSYYRLGDLATAVYLEGDVILTLGERVVRASRIFYDFTRDRALILDAVFFQEIPYRRIPFYVRADEVRQLSAREYSATRARVTTSEFYTPSYHVGADKVYIRDRTSRDAVGNATGTLAGTYELTNTTLNVDNLPILYWPYSRGDLEQSETVLRRFRTGYSDDFGVEVETSWYLFNLLGITPPPGYDATLKLDYFAERGPGIGVDGKYQQQDHFGITKNYFIYDKGEDNFGPVRDNTPDQETRGRTLWRHRHYLPNDWELTLEVSYASDPGFLEEYERNEWFEGKQQETVFYLKRSREVDAIALLANWRLLDLLANWRLLDFVTQTEHLPDLSYYRLGDALGPFVAYHESRVGGVRYRTDDRHVFDTKRFNNDGASDATFRGDAREEAELPIKLTGLNIVPFGSVRGSYWDGQPLASGGLWRGLGLYGVRGSGWLSKVYDDVESELFDIHRIRHIIQPDFAVWGAHSNTRSDNITPFDEGIETIDAVYGAKVGLRNTWQTKRGGEGRDRTVDLFYLNLEVGYFGGDRPEDEKSNGWADPLRPENSRPRNYAAAEFAWRWSDTTTLVYDANLDLNDVELDRHDVSLAIERNPRLAYVIGYRHAGDVDLDLVGGGFNYRFNEKHITAARIWYDTDRGRLGELTLSYIYKLPRWYVGFNVEFDEVFDDVSFSMSLWPEGIPEWTLGSRRFSQLGQTTAIKPDAKADLKQPK